MKMTSEQYNKELNYYAKQLIDIEMKCKDRSQLHGLTIYDKCYQTAKNILLIRKKYEVGGENA